MTLETPRELLDIEPAPAATRAKLTHDPVGVCMLLMFAGMPELAASTARSYLREAGAYAPEPGQASSVRSKMYALNGGKS